MNPKFSSWIRYTVITLIGALFLYFVFRGTDWHDLTSQFARAHYEWIAAGMAISLVSHWLRAYRAVMLYEALSYRVPVRNSFYAVMIGYMMNYIIPRGGEVSRCAALAKTDDIPVSRSLGTVVTERVFDLVMLLLTVLVVFFLQFDLLKRFIENATGIGKDSTSSSHIGLYLLLFLGALIILFFALRKKLIAHPLYIKVLALVKGFGEGLLSVRQVRSPLAFIVASIGIWICYLLMMYFCFFATDATKSLDFTACLTVFALGTIGMVIPAPGAGAGTYHFAIMQSLLLFGVSQQDGIAYATIVHGVQMILLLAIGAICSLLVLVMHKKKTV